MLDCSVDFEAPGGARSSLGIEEKAEITDASVGLN